MVMSLVNVIEASQIAVRDEVLDYAVGGGSWRMLLGRREEVDGRIFM